MNFPNIKGFSIDQVTAWWIICDRCGDSELVTGSTAEADAVDWVTEHYDEEHRQDVS